MIDNREVGRRIAELRQRAGLTQSQLAATMNVSHQAVSKWEGGAALPDIQTLMELTRFFGLTVEQLVSAEEVEESAAGGAAHTEDAGEKPAEAEENRVEANQMNIQQLLQMAPYMTKEAVAEIAMGMEDKLTANQIARLAPYLAPECVEALIAKHHPEFTWDSLRRLAPHMRRETVDELARAIASGRETVKGPEDNFNRTMNDIGKAFDDLGKGVDKAVRKAIRFGESVFNEVSSAFSDLSTDAPEAKARTERAAALRRRAFERALADGKWDWLGEHVNELEDGDELKNKIAARARELGMHEWLDAHLGGFADEFGVDAALRDGNWGWLGDNLHQLEPEIRRRVARAALDAENLEWLEAHLDELGLGEDAPEFARALWHKGAKLLAAQVAKLCFDTEKFDAFADEAVKAGDEEMADLLWDSLSRAYARGRLLGMADAKRWDRVREFIAFADDEALEALMELAVEQGDFDAVDFLDSYL